LPSPETICRVLAKTQYSSYIDFRAATGGGAAKISASQGSAAENHYGGLEGMESESIAFELPTLVDTEAPRRELVAMLSLAAISVWAFAVLSTAQALVI